MSVKFLVLGGGGLFWVFWGEGGSADFIFMGARIKLLKRKFKNKRKAWEIIKKYSVFFQAIPWLGVLNPCSWSGISQHKWTHKEGKNLRGPAAILWISRDTCSDSIAKMFCASFLWGLAQLSRDTLQNGVSHRCACVNPSTKRGFGSGVRKRVVSKRVVLADVPPERKPERGYVRQNHPFRNRPFISQ